MAHQASEKFQAIKITVTGSLERIDLDPAQLLQSLYTQIGCRYVEVVQATDTICLWVDEKGLMHRAQLNLVASVVAVVLGAPGYMLHGAVVATVGADSEGNTLPLNDRDLHILQTIVKRMPDWTETPSRPS